MLYHHVAHGLRWQLLFHDSEEARLLWDRIVTMVPALVSLCLMPDHLHLLARRAVVAELGRALSAFARARNHRRRETGPVFAPPGPPEVVPPGDKVPRLKRYVALNPCRAGLAEDPLAWPWSSYRDQVGLTVAPVVARSRDPHGLHRYTSSDPSVDVAGSLLPVAIDAVPAGPPGMRMLAAAVSEACRTPLGSTCDRKGRARTLLIRTARCTAGATDADVAAFLGISERAVRRVPRVGDDATAVVQRLLDDPRFPGLPGGDLRRLPAWRAWSERRRRRR